MRPRLDAHYRRRRSFPDWLLDHVAGDTPHPRLRAFLTHTTALIAGILLGSQILLALQQHNP